MSDSNGNNLNTIQSELLQFVPGSLEARTFALLHTHGVFGAPCPLCLISWLSRLSRQRNFAPIAIADEIRNLAYRQCGVVVSTCLEVLLYPERAGVEVRFEELAAMLEVPVAESQLDGLDLEMPPSKWRLN